MKLGFEILFFSMCHYSKVQMFVLPTTSCYGLQLLQPVCQSFTLGAPRIVISGEHIQLWLKLRLQLEVMRRRSSLACCCTNGSWDVSRACCLFGHKLTAPSSQRQSLFFHALVSRDKSNVPRDFFLSRLVVWLYLLLYRPLWTASFHEPERQLWKEWYEGISSQPRLVAELVFFFFPYIYTHTL